MMKIISYIINLAVVLTMAGIASADESLAHKLAGRILLQVEAHGESWYVNPADSKRYFLGRPEDAFNLMRKFGIGITDNDLAKIPVGHMNYDDKDDDGDGLANRLEEALGTDPQKADTDGDGHNDKTEIESGYSPTDSGRLPLDNEFACTQAGKIFLQVEGLGEAWYLSPTDCRRYYLGRPADAFAIMRRLSLGITNQDLEKIAISSILLKPVNPPVATSTPPVTQVDRKNPGQVFTAAATAIRTGDKTEAVKYFIPEMKKAIEYTVDYLDAEGELTLGNIISSASLLESTDTEKTYSTEVFFSLGGYKVPINFIIKKQPDNTWLITNL